MRSTATLNTSGGYGVTLEQVYYVGELVGVVVVVASLWFVAKEIRQNTNQLRVSASNAWVELQMRLVTGIAENREVAELWIKGETDADFEALDAVNQNRLVQFEFRALCAWSNLFELREQGLLPDAQWHELNAIIKKLSERRSIRESWKTFNDIYDKPFKNFAGQYLD